MTDNTIDLEEYFDADEWDKNEKHPGQLLCKNCGALYITDIEKENNCPVCSFTSFDMVGPRHDSDY